MVLTAEQVLEMASIEQKTPHPDSRWAWFEFSEGAPALVRVYADPVSTRPLNARKAVTEGRRGPGPLAMITDPEPGTDQFGVSLEIFHGEIDSVLTWEVADIFERIEADLQGFTINPTNLRTGSREFLTVVFACEHANLETIPGLAETVLSEIAKIGVRSGLKLAGVERRCGLPD